MNYRLFKNPDSSYRGKPFWAWNGKLDKEELVRQIHVFKDMGFGGFFMHSRTGLKTEYLGDEWFECIRVCALEAKKLGMEAWLYDEDRWPSGTAGGIVTKNPRFRQKFISMHRIKREEFDLIHYGQEYINSFAVKFNQNQEIVDYYEAHDITEVKPDYEVLIFIVEEQCKQEFYNGYTYLDTLNNEAVTAFLNQTLEKYKKECGDLLGKEIKGIFTDEPYRGCIFGGFSIRNKNARNMIPYTYNIFEAFYNKNGYDLRERLPEIYYFRQGKNWSKVSYDYVEILQQLFIDSFAKPYQKWCRENNIILTGHILHEDTLSCQVAVSGSVQRYYEYMDYPGIDILNEHNYNFWVAKQAVSVAKQLNKPFVLSELYGCTGWQLSFEDHKHIGDWQAISGINLRCHHLSWYTMEGEAKRDFPASISYQSAWFDNYSYVEDYFARVGYLLSLSEPVTDVVVINPIESLWGKVKLGCFNFLNAATEDIKDIEKNYVALFWELINNGIDFDYCDEDIISRHYRIKDNCLEIGEMKYRIVVLSDLITVRESTLKILKEFKEKGGHVIVKGTPQYIDGLKKDFDFNKFDIAESYCDIIDLCKRESRYKISGAANVFSNLRKAGDDYFLLMCNTDRENDIKDSVIEINLPFNAEEWDLRTGKVKGCSFEKTQKSVVIKTSFEKGGERCFRLTKHDYVPLQTETLSFTEVKMPDSLEYRLLEENVLVLDLAEYYCDGKREGFNEILKIDRAVREKFGLRYRGGEMIQPWYKEKYCTKDIRKNICDLTLKFSFNIANMHDEVSFALEEPHKFKIYVNGNELKQKITGIFIDNSIKKIELPVHMLKESENEILLSCKFSEEMNLEACYILGSFGVKIDGFSKTITKLPERLNNQPLSQQYLPFYTGKIEFFAKLPEGRYKIRFDSIKGACYEVVSESGKEIVAFSPYVTDIHTVKSEIKFILNCTRRNLFGPLHLTNLFQEFYAPDTFLTEGKDFQLSYGLIPEALTIPKVFKLISENEKR